MTRLGEFGKSLNNFTRKHFTVYIIFYIKLHKITCNSPMEYRTIDIILMEKEHEKTRKGASFLTVINDMYMHVVSLLPGICTAVSTLELLAVDTVEAGAVDENCW